MAITIGEWEKHFKTLSPDRRKELHDAIEALENDPVFKEQFGWTGLFALKISFDCVEIAIEREQKKV